MTSLFAKRVLIALARKLSFDSICFYQLSQQARNLYFLKMTHRKNLSYSILRVKDESTDRLHPLELANKNWVQALKSLEGKCLVYSKQFGRFPTTYETIDISSIEALIIDLELNGYLNKI